MKPPERREERMRWLARVALATLGSMTSFFIACAYGVPWRYEKTGTVRDAVTKQGIAGIRVACTRAPGDPAIAGETRTGADGRFFLGVDACDALAFADVDGAENGAYAGASLPCTPGDQLELVVELEPLP